MASEFVLYSYFRSSASYRVRIALNLKQIPYEYRAVHLLNGGGEQHATAYRDLNPGREVPTLVHRGNAIGQSMAIIQYLDDVAPNTRLFPVDPVLKAKIMEFCEAINSGIQPMGNLRVLQFLENDLGIDQEGRNRWVSHWLGRGYEVLDAMVKNTAGTYCFGGEPTAADTFLAPHVFASLRFDFPLHRYPVLERIYRNCMALPAFQKAAPDAQPDTPVAKP